MNNYLKNKKKSFYERVYKKLGLMNKCKHHNRKVRIEFMCNQCYLVQGNSKLASECPHKDRTHHSRGLCKQCYQKTYHCVVTDMRADGNQIKKIIDKNDTE